MIESTTDAGKISCNHFSYARFPITHTSVVGAKRLGFKQCSLLHITPLVLRSRCNALQTCYCPLPVSSSGKFVDHWNLSLIPERSRQDSQSITDARLLRLFDSRLRSFCPFHHLFFIHSISYFIVVIASSKRKFHLVF